MLAAFRIGRFRPRTAASHVFLARVRLPTGAPRGTDHGHSEGPDGVFEGPPSETLT